MARRDRSVHAGRTRDDQFVDGEPLEIVSHECTGERIDQVLRRDSATETAVLERAIRFEMEVVRLRVPRRVRAFTHLEVVGGRTIGGGRQALKRRIALRDQGDDPPLRQRAQSPLHTASDTMITSTCVGSLHGRTPTLLCCVRRYLPPAEPPLSFEDLRVEMEGPGGTFELDADGWRGTVNTILGLRDFAGPLSPAMRDNLRAHLEHYGGEPRPPSLCGTKPSRVGIHRKTPAPLVEHRVFDAAELRRTQCRGRTDSLREALWAMTRDAAIAAQTASPLPPPHARCRPDDSFSYRRGSLTVHADGSVEAEQGRGTLTPDVIRRIKCAFQRIDLGDTQPIEGSTRRTLCSHVGNVGRREVDVVVEGHSANMSGPASFRRNPRDANLGLRSNHRVDAASGPIVVLRPSSLRNRRNLRASPMSNRCERWVDVARDRCVRICRNR